jgi:hypothetical protein
VDKVFNGGCGKTNGFNGRHRCRSWLNDASRRASDALTLSAQIEKMTGGIDE